MKVTNNLKPITHRLLSASKQAPAKMSELEKQKITELTNCFKDVGLDRADILKMLSKHSSMLAHSSSRIEYNIREVVKRFSEFGLTVKDYLQRAVMISPSLASAKPETIENNVKNSAKAIPGLTVSEYLKNCLKNSTLFQIKPEKLKENYESVVKELKPFGLEEEKYTNNMKTCPGLYICNGQNLKNNLTNITKLLPEVKIEELVETAQKQPQVFYMKPKIFAAKYQLLKYIEQNKNLQLSEDDLKKNVLKKSFTNSMDYNYLVLLRNKLKEQTNTGIPVKHLKENMRHVLLADKYTMYNISVLPGKYAKPFIYFVHNYSRKLTGRNLFKINIT